jgi:ribosomal protein S18 acetylase RimI-like enzyme
MTSINFLYAGEEHLEWLVQQEKSHHLTKEIVLKKIIQKEIIVVILNQKPIGWLRFGFFWDTIPFMNLLFILSDHRRNGIGKRLVTFWEDEMKNQKHQLLLTSTLSNENAQYFYRNLGYHDNGSLLLPGEATEIFLIKKI